MTEDAQSLGEQVSRRRRCQGLKDEDDVISSSDQPHAKKMRSQYALVVSGNTQRGTQASLEKLAPDLVCHVLDFLGATSSCLIKLSQVNKHLRNTMSTIGDAMIPRALLHFRTPLKPKSVFESSTSLFIRHARIYSRVLADIAYLRSVVGKTPDAIEEEDVMKALMMTFDLLEVVPAFSEPLDRQILATCGQCGGKAFKYSKILLRGSAYNRSSPSVRHHEEFLAMSRHIMQIVVSRQLQLSKQAPLSLHFFVQKQIEAKQLQETGCAW